MELHQMEGRGMEAKEGRRTVLDPPYQRTRTVGMAIGRRDSWSESSQRDQDGDWFYTESAPSAAGSAIEQQELLPEPCCEIWCHLLVHHPDAFNHAIRPELQQTRQAAECFRFVSENHPKGSFENFCGVITEREEMREGECRREWLSEASIQRVEKDDQIRAPRRRENERLKLEAAARERRAAQHRYDSEAPPKRKEIKRETAAAEAQQSETKRKIAPGVNSVRDEEKNGRQTHRSERFTMRREREKEEERKKERKKE
jgi:hypothetical protein